MSRYEFYRLQKNAFPHLYIHDVEKCRMYRLIGGDPFVGSYDYKALRTPEQVEAFNDHYGPLVRLGVEDCLELLSGLSEPYRREWSERLLGA